MTEGINSTNMKNSNLRVTVNSQSIMECFRAASKRLSPLWDVRDYVAVNPLFGYRDQPFLQAIDHVRHLSGAELLPESDHFLKKFLNEEIIESDLNSALSIHQAEHFGSKRKVESTEELISFLRDSKSEEEIDSIQCLSDLYDRQNGTHTSIEITDQVSKWAAAYFDEGQAVWRIPKENLRFFTWWKSLVKYDPSFNHSGLGFKDLIHGIPTSPELAIEKLVERLLRRVDLTHSELTNYFQRLIFTTLGWCSYIQKFEFEAERKGDPSELKTIGGLIDILALRLSYDVALLNDGLDLKKFALQLRPKEKSDRLEKRYIWLLASEIAYSRKIEDRIKSRRPVETQKNRLQAQMAFCIDVRSEILRRHIESKSPNIQTIGFAGFFGVPISIQGLGHQNPDQQCPVLLNSNLIVPEKSMASEEKIKRKISRTVKSIYLKRRIQSSTNSGFSFMETFGFSYIYKMISASLGLSSPNLTATARLSEEEAQSITLETSQIPLQSQVDLAYGALKNMGLTKNFSRYVFFFGHGSESANNPYSSALDCGACAGHNGHGNSKFLSLLLNNDSVREQLKGKGIDIPKDTLFVSGWHNTAIDALSMDGLDSLKVDKDFMEILKVLDEASDLTRRERFGHLPHSQGLSGGDLFNELNHRSRDWSEIRPEWGLARNASFIVAKRSLTRELNLDGRSFLHDYDASNDPDLSILELIMTAPMIVTNWINMQYYASAIDPIRFGAGNKVLNNVTGTIGCIQGNSGDLLGGLTEQSVRYRGDYFHEPLRLQVFIEAPSSSIDKIIEKHQMVKDLSQNGWLRLISIDPQSREFKVYGSNRWMNVKEDLWN